MTDDTKTTATKAFWVFAAAWSISLLLRQIHRQDFFTSPLCSAVTVMAALCIVRPSSAARFVFLNFLCILHYLVHAPAVGHQELVALFVELAVVAAALSHAVASRSLWTLQSTDGAALLVRFSAPIRVVAVIVYLWAVVQKLNTEYLWNYGQSCGALLSAAIPESFPRVYSESIATVQPGEAASLFGIWSTLVLETAIPLLLVFRRTALLGALLGVAFHGFLGFVYWWHFSALLYALYVLFLPGAAMHAIADAIEDIARRIGERWRIGLELALAIGFPVLALCTYESPALQHWLASFKTFAWKGVALDVPTLFGWVPFCLYAGFVLYLCARTVRAHSKRPGDVYAPIRPTPAVVVFALLAFANGLAPHLGLKTSQTFTMYSNLRIEPGASNHLFIPASLQLAPYHDDTAVVLAKSDAIPSGPWFIGVEVGWTYPFIELRRRISALARKGVTGMSITLLRNGTRVVIEHAELDPELGEPLPYLAEKLFVYEQYRPERIVCP